MALQEGSTYDRGGEWMDKDCRQRYHAMCRRPKSKRRGGNIKGKQGGGKQQRQRKVPYSPTDFHPVCGISL